MNESNRYDVLTHVFAHFGGNIFGMIQLLVLKHLICIAPDLFLLLYNFLKMLEAISSTGWSRSNSIRIWDKEVHLELKLEVSAF